MVMLSKKRRDRLIIALALLLFLFSSYYFFLGIHFQETGKLPDIGEVFKKNNELRRKTESSLAWIDIEHSSKLFPGDKVFTGSESLAQLHLLDLVSVGMNSSTLLKVDPKLADGIGLHAGLGFFTTTIAGKVNKATVALKNASFEMSGQGSEMHVNGLEDKIMVAAIAGKVNFNADGKSLPLAPNQLLGMNRAGVTTLVNLPVKLISPAVGEEIVTAPRSPVEFKWKTLIQNSPLSLELSKTPSFEVIFFKKQVTGLQQFLAHVTPESGTIYWRIVQPGKDEYYHAQEFSFHPLNPIVIYEPTQKQNYPLPVIPAAPTSSPTGSLPSNVVEEIYYPEFSWEKRFNFIYEGEIKAMNQGGNSTASKFETIKFTAENPAYLAKTIPAGFYALRVRATSGKKMTDWSEWRFFSMGMGGKGVELVSPEEMATAKFLLPQKEVAFEWRGSNGPAQLQIASDPDFKTLLFDEVTEKTTLHWRPKKEGKYYWRVKSSTSNATIRTFMIVEPKVVLNLPRDKFNYHFTNEKSAQIEAHFSWNNVSLDDHYIFELSDSEDFSKIITHSETVKPEFTRKFKNKIQILYWRVKTLNQISPVYSFRIVNPDTYNVDLLKVKIQEDNTVFGGTTEHAANKLGVDYVEIFLPQIESANAYHIEVFKDASTKRNLLSKNLSSPLFRWDNPPVGNFYWRFSYSDKKGNQGPLSKLSKLLIEPKDKRSTLIKQHDPAAPSY